MRNFTNDDRKRLYAMWTILAQEKGPGFAMNAIESWMERYVNGDGSGGQWG